MGRVQSSGEPARQKEQLNPEGSGMKREHGVEAALVSGGRLLSPSSSPGKVGWKETKADEVTEATSQRASAH